MSQRALQFPNLRATWDDIFVFEGTPISIVFELAMVKLWAWWGGPSAPAPHTAVTDPSSAPATNPSQHIAADTEVNNSAETTRPEQQDHKNHEMVKRRARMPVSMFDRPLISQVDFIVDPRYYSLKVVGLGSFGIVASAFDSVSSQRVAIKKILVPFASAKTARYVLREVRLLRHLQHPNIVHLLDIDVPQQFRSWDGVYIVTPLLHMDLSTALKKGLLQSPIDQKKVAFHILSGLQHMHSLGLMHRDIKSRNIVLDEHLNAQICDLGHSRFYSKSNRTMDFELDSSLNGSQEPGLSTGFTTVVQAAPEVTLSMDYDATVDVWSAGCVIAQMIQPTHDGLFDRVGRTGHLSEIIKVSGAPSDEELATFPDHAQWMIRRLMKRRKNNNQFDKASPSSTIRQSLGEEADPAAVDLVEKMLQFSPNKRLTAGQALAHPWFDDVRHPPKICVETYHFEQSEPHRKATKAELKELVWQEVTAIHPEALEMGIH